MTTMTDRMPMKLCPQMAFRRVDTCPGAPFAKFVFIALDNRSHTKRHDKGRYLKPMDSHSVDKSHHHTHDNNCKKRSGQISFGPS